MEIALNDIRLEEKNPDYNRAILFKSIIFLTYLIRSITTLFILYTILFYFDIITTTFSLNFILFSMIFLYGGIYGITITLTIKYIKKSKNKLKNIFRILWIIFRLLVLITIFIIGFNAATERLLYKFQLFAISGGLLFLEAYMFRTY